MGDATGSGCSEVGSTETGACVDGAGTMDDDGPGGGGRQDRYYSKREINRRQQWDLLCNVPKREQNSDNVKQDQQDTYTN